jgi:hypothetical protein
MHRNLRGGSVDRLVRALTLLSYRFYKAPHEYKRGKFHVEITVSSASRCSLGLHRDRSVLAPFAIRHQAIWGGKDVSEEMNKIMAKYHELRDEK